MADGPIRKGVPPADYGTNHSVAALFGAQHNFFANLFLGNSASGLADLALFIHGDKTPSKGDIAGVVLKGGAQGIPMPPGNPGLSGAVGQARGAALTPLIQAGVNAARGAGSEIIELGITDAGPIVTPIAQLGTEDAGNIAYGAGLVKFGIDASTFLFGLWKGCQQ